MAVADLVDAAAGEPVLVVGALPPQGRDLDLLARPAAAARLAEALRANGFEQSERQWVRFADGTAEVVDLVPVADWRLPVAESEALFARALPIAGFSALVAPAPADELLSVARKVARSGRLSDGRRARVAAAVAADPSAWETATERSASWGLPGALVRLRTTYQSDPGSLTTPPTDPGSSLRAALWRARQRPRIVTFSGLDGAGKTSQAEALARALTALGYRAEIEWTRITHERAALDRVGLPAKQLLPRRGPALTWLWTFVVSWANGRSQRRAARGHPGAVVIHDRYTLDSAAHLRAKYGAARRFRPQVALVRWLSPRPVAAYFLDVDAATAHARKPEKYTVERLAEIADLYREECPRLGVQRLDGSRPADDIAAHVAREVWRRLAP